MRTLILEGDYEQWIIRMIADKTGIAPSALTLDRRLLQDLGVTGDDAYELLEEYSKTFQVDMGTFKFMDHFRDEAHWGQGKSLAPITVRDLVESARQKKWVCPAP